MSNEQTVYEIYPHSILKKNEKLLHNEIDNEIVILSISNEEYIHLNIVGSRIWEFISEPKSFSEIVEDLISIYNVSEKQCYADTKEYLLELINSDLVILNNA